MASPSEFTAGADAMAQRALAEYNIFRINSLYQKFHNRFSAPIKITAFSGFAILKMPGQAYFRKFFYQKSYYQKKCQKNGCSECKKFAIFQEGVIL